MCAKTVNGSKQLSYWCSGKLIFLECSSMSNAAPVINAFLSYTWLSKAFFLMFFFSTRKNLLKSMSGKDMGILIYFPWIGKKYSHTLGNLWKLVSHIWELGRFLNSIDFYSKPMVWEYISFPQYSHSMKLYITHTLWIIWIS